MTTKKKAATPKRVARESGETIDLLYKNKITTFGIHRMTTQDALQYIDQLSGMEEGQEQTETAQRYLLLNGKFVFQSPAQIDEELGGLDVLTAYKKVIAVNRVAEFVESIKAERDLLKK